MCWITVVKPIRGQNETHASALDRRLRAVVAAVGGLVCEYDRDARYIDIWADDPQLLLAPREQMIGKSTNELIGEELGAPFTALVRNIHDTGAATSFQYPQKVAGRDRWFVADCKRIESGDGYRVLLVARDITEQKAQQEALRLSEERYRLAARATNDVFYDVHLGTRVVTWGPNASSVFRDSAIEASADYWESHVHPDDFPRIIATLRAAIDGGAESWQESYRFRRGDGTYADILDRCFLVRVERAVRAVGSMADVSELNRLQTQLVQADRLASLGTLAAGVGHEINNPLTYVVGNLDLALDSKLDADTESALKDARDGVGRIVEIVKTLKLFSRGDAKVERGVRINAVVERALKMADNEIRHRARLVRELGTVPAVNVSESQLGQVCLNLVVNAAQAISRGNVDDNEIRIETGVDSEGRVTIAVSDTGGGIPQEHLGRIFDPFFTTKPVGIGTGLGLSVCQNIVRSMGGEMTVKSASGIGTTFTVHIPVEEAAPASVRHPSLPPMSVRATRPQVLVVDDEPGIGRLVTRLLRRECDITVAENGAVALQKIEASAGGFDVIFCDVMMPVMNGMELWGALLEKHPKLLARLHFMTGGVFTPTAARFMEKLAHPPLEKPVDRDQLLRIVHTTYKKLLVAA